MANPKDLNIKNAKNGNCPWSGNQIDEGSLTTYKGQVVGFCNTGCRDKFEKAVDLFDELRWVNDENIQETTLRDALHGALLIAADRMTQADQRRMRTVLKFIGFEKCGVYKDRTKRDQARYIRVMG